MAEKTFGALLQGKQREEEEQAEAPSEKRPWTRFIFTNVRMGSSCSWHLQGAPCCFWYYLHMHVWLSLGDFVYSALIHNPLMTCCAGSICHCCGLEPKPSPGMWGRAADPMSGKTKAMVWMWGL